MIATIPIQASGHDAIHLLLYRAKENWPVAHIVYDDEALGLGVLQLPISGYLELGEATISYNFVHDKIVLCGPTHEVTVLCNYPNWIDRAQEGV